MNFPYGKTQAGIHLSEFINDWDKRHAGSIYTEISSTFKSIHKSNIKCKKYLYNLIYKDALYRLDISEFNDIRTKTYMKNVIKSIFTTYICKSKEKK